MLGGSGAWIRSPGAPLDEEREHGLLSRSLDSSHAPPENGPVRARPRSVGDAQSQPPRYCVEIVGPDAPAQQPRSLAARDPAAECAPCGLGFVDDRNELEIGIDERHDPVRGPQPAVPAALDRREPVALLEPLTGGCEVGDRDQDVVELHDA